MPEQKPPDPLDAAIAAAEAPKIEMVQIQIALLTGRPAVLAVPKDMSDVELLHLIGNVLALGDQLRAQRPSSRIVLPRGVAIQ